MGKTALGQAAAILKEMERLRARQEGEGAAAPEGEAPATSEPTVDDRLLACEARLDALETAVTSLLEAAAAASAPVPEAKRGKGNWMAKLAQALRIRQEGEMPAAEGEAPPAATVEERLSAIESRLAAVEDQLAALVEAPAAESGDGLEAATQIAAAVAATMQAQVQKSVTAALAGAGIRQDALPSAGGKRGPAANGSLLEQYRDIRDPKEKAAFRRKHKEALAEAFRKN